MTVQIQLRRGTAAAWTAANPTLSQGELGLETDTGKIKMGDGTTAWTTLGYFGGAPSGAAGGDLSGTYPNPSVVDESHAHSSTSVTTHSTAHAHSATTGQTATDHHPAPAAGPDADVTVDAAGSAGTAATFARSGHGHKLATSASAGTALGAAAAGTSGHAPSRDDHVHNHGTGTVANAHAHADLSGVGASDHHTSANDPTSGEKTWLTNALAGQAAFPATQNASAGANTLDDYEEGTWTPVFSYATAGTSSWSVTTQLGWYTKIGNRVFYEFSYQGVPTNGTASGQLLVSGLPYASVNTANEFAVTGCLFQGYTKANFTQISAKVFAANSTQMNFQAAGSAQTIAALAVGDIPSAGTVIVRAAGHYATP